MISEFFFKKNYVFIDLKVFDGFQSFVVVLIGAQIVPRLDSGSKLIQISSWDLMTQLTLSENFFAFWGYILFQIYLYYSCLRPGISHLFKEALFSFSGKWYLETTIQC